MTNRKGAQPLRRQSHRIRRRELVLLLGGTMTAARSLGAQQKVMPVIGFLSSGSPGPTAPYVAAFRQGLSESNYLEGKNVAIEFGNVTAGRRTTMIDCPHWPQTLSAARST